MKKVKVMFIIERGILGGTERSAMLYAKKLNKNLFEPLFIVSKPIDEEFRKRFGELKYEIISSDEIPRFAESMGIQVILDFTSLDGKAIENLKKSSKVLRFVVFTENYSFNADSNLMISKTEYLKAKLYHKDNFGKKDYVVYFPVDLDFWHKLDLSSSIKPYYTDDKKIVVGRLARAEPSKWHYLLLATLHQFKRKKALGKFTFVFAGMPKLYEKYIEIFFREELNKKNIILLPELASDEDVARFYKSLDVFIQTSWIGESFGCVIAESFCFGVPVISDWKGFLNKKNVDIKRYDTQIELVDLYKNGFYANHPETIYKFLTKLNRKELKLLGKNGSEKIKRLYNVDKVVANLEHILLGPILNLKPELNRRIYPSHSEINSFPSEYANRIFEARTIESSLTKKEKIRYNLQCVGWRCIEWVYLLTRRLLRIFSFDIERRNS